MRDKISKLLGDMALFFGLGCLGIILVNLVWLFLTGNWPNPVVAWIFCMSLILVMPRIGARKAQKDLEQIEASFKLPSFGTDDWQ